MLARSQAAAKGALDRRLLHLDVPRVAGAAHVAACQQNLNFAERRKTTGEIFVV